MKLKLYFSKLVFIFLVLNLNSSSAQLKQDILPIQLLYFQGYVLNYGVLLRWGTATEINNFGFDIQRADSTKIFISIGFEPGSGNSNSPKHYFFVDSTLPGEGIYYYRLRQIDFDGTSHLSDTISIYYSLTSIHESTKDIKKENFSLINDKKNKSIRLVIPKVYNDKALRIRLFNITGELLFENANELTNPTFYYSYSHLSNGVYLISIISDNKIIFNQKFYVLK